eukprot:CAMPEP_0174856178 /NCGR_PEP_ID=MMETSP1114-20130205/35270_1 /TAXON_ID=312471 /ORGANISM="Neobodo designis, Strain CCAP 1951/1" /LENGTH=273 /DNA_ID=CAMNT_0016090963 /DNA_START=47 /DNA_END=864 /DNA_ORIENTATION=+
MADQVTFPEKFHFATRFVDRAFGDLEKCQELEDVKKLALYALRRQATDGPCKEAAPYMWNVTERFKHQAWSQLGSMSPFEAMFQYANLLDGLRPGWLEDQYRFEQAESEETSKPADSQEVVPADAPASETASSGTAVASAAKLDDQNRDLADVKESLRWHPTSFDDTGLSSEVSEDNVRLLVAEVLRLRQLLADHGIDPSPPPPVASASPAAPQLRTHGQRVRGAPGRLTSRPRSTGRLSTVATPVDRDSGVAAAAPSPPHNPKHPPTAPRMG